MYCKKCGATLNKDGLFCPKCGSKVEPTNDDSCVYEYKSQVFFNLTYRVYFWALLGVSSFLCMIFKYLQTDISGYNVLAQSRSDIDTTKLMIILLIINNVMVIFTGLASKYLHYILARILMIIEILLYFIYSFSIYYDLAVKNKITDLGIGCYINITVAVSSFILYFICRRADLCLEVNNK